MNERQSAAKPLNAIAHEECSTTIPRKGSRLEILLVEKPDIILKKLTDKKDSRLDAPGIYILYCLDNDNFYIGSSTNIHKRIGKHKSALINNKHYATYLQNSFNKYGIDSILVLTLELTCNLEERELHWIRVLKPQFNSSEDVQRNFLNPKYYKAILESKIKQQKQVVELTLDGIFVQEFLSITDTARFHNTSSTNISGVCKGRIRQIRNCLFIYKTEYNPISEYKVRERLLVGTRNPLNLSKIIDIKGVKVKCINTKSNDIIIYKSISEAARSHDIAYHNLVNRHLKNKRLLGDLKFKYYEDIV